MEKNVILPQEEYTKNRKLSQLASTIASGAAAEQVQIPEDQALYLQTYAGLSKVGYTALRCSLLPLGVTFPTYDSTAQHRRDNVVPKIVVGNEPQHYMESSLSMCSGGVQRC